MEITIRSQAPMARCYECGVPEVDMVCHHCGQPMCEDDGRAIVATSTDASSHEFVGLGLEEMVGRARIQDRDRWEVHCRECSHKAAPSYAWMIWLGGILAILGLLIAMAGGEAGLVALILLIGLGLLVAGVWLQSERAVPTAEGRELGIPLVPRVNTLKVSDVIKGQMSLDAKGQYISQVQSCTGSLSVCMSFTPQDRERCETYRGRQHLSDEEDMPFHAGFVVLDGPAQLRFLDSDICLSDRINVMALTGMVSQHPFLAGSEGRRDNIWDIRWDYEFLAGEDVEGGELPGLPVHLMPFLTEGADRKALELELQLSQDGADFESVKIESLELLAPTRLGRVEDVRPNALLTPAVQEKGRKEAYQGVTWRQLAFTRKELQVGRKSFYVRFANEIEPQTRLLGTVRAVFGGNITGLEGVQVFYPWGRKRDDVTIEQETAVEITFELDLAALRYQDSLTLHDTVIYDDVVPDYALVTALTDALSEEELYVKWIVENPPRTSRRGAHIINRYWDIAGRMYDGAFPVDWHLVMTGEEAQWQEVGESPGSARFDLSLQASVANEEMRQLVHNLHARMKAIIADTIAAH